MEYFLSKIIKRPKSVCDNKTDGHSHDTTEVLITSFNLHSNNSATQTYSFNYYQNFIGIWPKIAYVVVCFSLVSDAT